MEEKALQCPHCKKNTFFIIEGVTQKSGEEKQTLNFKELGKTLAPLEKKMFAAGIPYFNEGEDLWAVLKIGALTYLQKLPAGSLKASGKTQTITIGEAKFKAIPIKGSKPTQKYISEKSVLTATTGWQAGNLAKHIDLVKGDVLCYFYNTSIDFSSKQEGQEEIEKSFTCDNLNIRSAMKYFIKLFGEKASPEFMLGKDKAFFCMKDKGDNTFILMKGREANGNTNKN